MKQKVTFARNDLADLVDFLATLHIKENASSYRLNNYLQQRNLCCMAECLQIEFTASWFEQKNRHHNNWKLSASGRMQVGQWLYRSKFVENSAGRCCCMSQRKSFDTLN